MAKNRVSFIGLKCIDKIIVTVILRIGLWMVVMLVTPFMVFANGTDRITTSSSENIVISGEVAKNEKNIEKQGYQFIQSNLDFNSNGVPYIYIYNLG